MKWMAAVCVGTRTFPASEGSRGLVTSRAVVVGRWPLTDRMNADDKECSFLISDWSVLCCYIVLWPGKEWQPWRFDLLRVIHGQTRGAVRCRWSLDGGRGGGRVGCGSRSGRS